MTATCAKPMSPLRIAHTVAGISEARSPTATRSAAADDVRSHSNRSQSTALFAPRESHILLCLNSAASSENSSSRPSM